VVQGGTWNPGQSAIVISKSINVNVIMIDIFKKTVKLTSAWYSLESLTTE
jgi:hypothetical protein